ncbi:hypothetical protein QUS22_03890 [Wolbachia pipientis]|nr:hypothetical protein [Wolbachia pipientis]
MTSSESEPVSRVIPLLDSQTAANINIMKFTKWRKKAKKPRVANFDHLIL